LKKKINKKNKTKKNNNLYILIIIIIIVLLGLCKIVSIDNKPSSNRVVDSAAYDETIWNIPSKYGYVKIDAIDNDKVVKIVKSSFNSYGKRFSNHYSTDKPEDINEFTFSFHNELCRKLKRYGLVMNELNKNPELDKLQLEFKELNNYLITKGWYCSYINISDNNKTIMRPFLFKVCMIKSANISNYDDTLIPYRIILASGFSYGSEKYIKNQCWTEKYENNIIFDIDNIKATVLNVEMYVNNYQLYRNNLGTMMRNAEWLDKYQNSNKKEFLNYVYVNILKTFEVHELQHVKDYQLRTSAFRNNYNLQDMIKVDIFLEAHAFVAELAKGPIQFEVLGRMNEEIESCHSQIHHCAYVFVKKIIIEDNNLEGTKLCNEFKKVILLESILALELMDEFYEVLINNINTRNIYDKSISSNKKFERLGIILEIK